MGADLESLLSVVRDVVNLNDAAVAKSKAAGLLCGLGSC